MSGGRKIPAHPPFVERFKEPTILFVTVCAKDRQRVLANPETFHLLRTAWREAKGWLVGRFVIMPNHLHFLCSPDAPPLPGLSAWMRYWKNIVARKWPRPEEHPLWQKDYWDTQICHLTHFNAKLDYIRQNPVKAGLVDDADAWPYQGELNPLRW